MNPAKAVLCALLVYVLSEAVKRKVPKLWAAGDLFIALGLGVGAVFLVATTVWSHSEVINGVALDDMNVGSKIVGGLILGAGAVGIDKVLAAVSNIGVPMVKRPYAAANHTDHPVAGTGLTGARAEAGVVDWQRDVADNGYPGGVAPTDADVAALGQ